jgi:hypothetical protein
MILDKFLVFFAWFHVVYTATVFLLILQYTRTNGGMIFILLQSTYTAVVLATQRLFPGFVERTGHLNMFKSVKPLVGALEAVHLFVLGTLWERYHARGATFSIFFPVLIVLKILEFAAFAMVSGKKHL